MFIGQRRHENSKRHRRDMFIVWHKKNQKCMQRRRAAKVPQRKALHETLAFLQEKNSLETMP
jgi:hypothetical protein